MANRWWGADATSLENEYLTTAKLTKIIAETKLELEDEIGTVPDADIKADRNLWLWCCLRSIVYAKKASANQAATVTTPLMGMTWNLSYINKKIDTLINKRLHSSKLVEVGSGVSGGVN